MNTNDESRIQAPIWIRLIGILIGFWVEDMLQGITNAFGELILMDLVEFLE